MLLDSTR